MKDNSMKKEKPEFTVSCNFILKILIYITTAAFILQLLLFTYSTVSVKINQNKIKQLTGELLIVNNKINTTKNKIAEIESR